ncbi:hypothetical protein C8Q74DRAFT_312316 [Fomes fomentarius]|nr:hypothetical protein C8Q74DRAFT_312316 [Fomes fomentarius]
MLRSDLEDIRRGIRQQRNMLCDQVEALPPQEDAIRRRIADLDEQLNSTTDINMLPVEILINIFKLVVVPLTPEEALSARVAARWTENVFPVCRHWRRVVCSTPSLWRVVGVCSTPEWLALCVARSAELPVDVSVQQWPVQSMTSLLHSLSSKIRSLALTSAKHYRYTSFSALPSNSYWPALEDLYIRADGCPSLEVGWDPKRFPQLRSLTMETSSFPKDQSHCPPLRILHLRGFFRPIPMTQFLYIVESMQSLEQLSIDLYDRWQPAAPSDPGRLISLPQLRKANLRFRNYQYASYILAQIHIPSATSVEIAIEVFDSCPDRLFGFLPSDPSSILPMRMDTTSVDVIVDTRKTSYPEPVVALRARNRDYTSAFDLSLTVHGTKLLNRACQELTHILPTACLTSLRVQGYYLSYVSRATWQNMLAHYPDLESIALVGYSSGHRFWEALQPQPNTSSLTSSLSSPMNHHAAVPCPRLKSISLVLWNVVQKVDTGSWVMPNALWSRKEHGHPVATLRLEGWNWHRTPTLRPSDTEYLHKLASSVEQVMYKSMHEPEWSDVLSLITPDNPNPTRSDPDQNVSAVLPARS